MTEQKWFIYISDHHEGPFTPKEILDGIAQSKFPKEAFVWADGMPDWLSIDQVPDFKISKPATPPPRAEKQPAETIQFVTKSSLKEEAPVVEEEAKKSVPEFTQKRFYQKREFKFAASFFVLGIVLLYVYQTGLITKFFVRLPAIPQVAGTEYQDLKKTAQQPLSQGPAFAFAVSTEDQLSPLFYVATNLPSGTQLEMYVQGVPHTLLNTLQFSGTLKATTEGNLAKTQPLRYPDGRAIPRGEYQVFITEAAEQSSPEVQKELSSLSLMARDVPGVKNLERRVFYSKRVFLGQRDATYLTRLKEYHDRLTNKATQELAEAKQVLSLLESQWETTAKNFDRIKKIKNVSQKAAQWRAAESTWRSLEKQLQKTFEKYTKQTLIEDVYHGEIYARLSNASNALSDYHQRCADFVLKASEVTEEQIEGRKTAVQGFISTIKERMKTIESQPVDAYGLPARAPYQEGENYGG